MSLKDAFVYCIRLMAQRPVIILPALAIIFFTTIVIHGALLIAFRLIFGSLYNVKLDLLLLDLLISIVVGIFLHAFYVGIAKQYSKNGKFSMAEAAEDVNKHKGQIGMLGIAVHFLTALLAGILVACLLLDYYHFGFSGTIGELLIALAIIALLALIYVATIFFELNVAIIVENLSGIAALKRTISMAYTNLPKMLAAVFIVGALYAFVYLFLNLISHNYTGIWQTVFAYVSIIPYALVTILFDLMAPGLYYNLIEAKGKPKHGRNNR